MTSRFSSICSRISNSITIHPRFRTSRFYSQFPSSSIQPPHSHAPKPEDNLSDDEDTTTSLETAFKYCQNTLLKEEPQMYDTLQSLKCTSTERLAAIILRTFHYELSCIRSDSQSVDAARLRLAWWKSALNELLNEQKNMNLARQQINKKLNKERDPELRSQINTTINPYSLLPSTQSTPVLQALRIVRRRYNLNPDWLLNLVTSREILINSNTFLSMTELEEYAENTQASLLYLTMECLGVAYDMGKAKVFTGKHFECASHISAFITIVNVIRSVPESAVNGFICLPDDICMDFQLWEHESYILQGGNCPQLQSAIESMMEQAYAHLIRAQGIRDEHFLNEKLISMMLCSLPAQRYISKLEKYKCNVFDQRLLQPDLGIGWKFALKKRSIQNSF